MEFGLPQWMTVLKVQLLCMHAENEGAHLRWFIISDILRGKGVGRKLINRAIDFCKSKGYKKTYLWTFDGLNAARHLYENAGFKLISACPKSPLFVISTKWRNFECQYYQ